MKKNNYPIIPDLRQKAEELYKTKSLTSQSLNITDLEVMKHVHELEVHQIELEMMNEGLIIAKEKAEALATDKYAELYDFAPTGYFTLSKIGEIIELNLSGAKMLGKERMKLINNHFGFFVSDESKHIFTLFIENVFNKKTTEFCNITLLNKNNLTSYVHLAGIANPNADQCFVTVVDISQYWLEHEKLKQSELRNESFFENSKFAMILVHPETAEIIDANIAACDYYGWTRAEMQKKNIAEINVLTQTEIAAEMLKAKTDKRNQFFFKHLLASGEIRDVEVYSGPLKYDDKTYLYSIIHDISNRIQAEENLIKNEEKYHRIFDTAQDAYYESSPDGILLDISPSIKTISKGQYTQADLIGKSLVDFYADTKDRVSLYSILITKGKVIDYELLLKNKDGSTIPVAISSSMMKDTDGNPFMITGSIRNITNRKIAENALKASEDKYRNLIESQSEGIGLVDENEVFTFVNPAALRIFETDNLIGRSLFDFLTPPEIQKIHQQTQSRRNGISTNYELQIITPGNKIKYLSVSTQPKYDENAKYEGAFGVFSDISERKYAQDALKHSEERFSQVIAQSNDVVWEVDLDGLYLFVSPMAEDIYGYSPEEMIGKMHFYDLLVEDQAEQLKMQALDFIKKTGNLVNFITKVVRKDGLERIISSNGVRTFNDKGENIGFRGITTDITEQINADKEIAKFRTIADQANYGVILFSLQGAFLYVNDAFAQMVGWDASDLLGKDSSVVHNDEQAQRNDEITAMMMAYGQCSSEELFHIRKDGTAFPTLLNAKIIFDEDKVPQYISTTIIDITERKRNEEEFQKIYKAVEQSPVMTVVTNLTGNIEYVNPAFTKVTGYTKEELIGQNPRILKSDEKSEKEYKVLYEMLNSGRNWQGEFNNKKKNGELYWTGALISPIFDLNGEITHYVAVEEDITYRKQIEKELLELNSNLEHKVQERTLELNELNQKLEKELAERLKIEKILRWNETLLQLMANSSPLGFLIVDNRTDNILYFNERFCQIWEIEQLADRMYRGELKNNDIIPYCLPVLTDIPAFAESCAPLQDENNRVVVEDEIPFTRNRIVRRFSTQIRGENDEYFGRFYIFEDITERKLAESELFDSEQRFSLFMDYLPAVVFMKDKESKMIYANNSMEIALGVSDWIDKPLTETFDDETVERILSDDKNTLNASYQIIEESFTNLDGKLHDYETQKFVIPRLGKEPLLGGISLDITMRKQAELKALQAKDEAEKANMAKSEFLSRMSHELRTPMNSILGFAQLLQMGELNVSQKRGVNHILSSGKLLLDLINEVLDISRIEAGNLSISIEPVQLKAIYAEMLDVMNPLASKQGIRIKLFDSMANELFVNSDRHSLKQILLNLLNNAVKYNKNGGSVSIYTETRLNNDLPFIRISISDTGIGINTDDISKLFTPFERIGSEKTGIEGTGLGLAIVKRMLDVMGGTYGVESLPEKGSTFWIELPQAESQDDLLDKSEQMDNIAENTFEYGGTILYIEDNLSNIELIEQVLTNKRPGIKLINSTLGKQTIKLSIDYKPDLILLDLNLPDIDGAEVLKLILANDKTKNIPVVIISADGMQHQVDKLLKAGAKKYLTKPLDITLFLKVTDELIQN